MSWPIRFGFCTAIAVIAAAIADPLVESASNAGWFGPGLFTDRSNLDVAPMLLVGVLLLIVYLVSKAQAALANGSRRGRDVWREAGHALGSGIWGLIPAIFGLQMLTLYAMETAEQHLVWGHSLGPMVWLGGPLPASLAVHAIICVALAVTIARWMRALTATTLRFIRLIRALATFAPQPAGSIASRSRDSISFKRSSPVFCRIGERAPPLLSA
jgi:hypothetical protein